MPISQSSLPHACLECKRLKLKCDKQQPCSSCVRRGCSDICPDGKLVAGKGTRFILSNTKNLHDEIDSLRARVKELEGTLGALNSQVTIQPHPLLKESLKIVSEKLQSSDKDVKPEPLEDESLIDTFGSLTIDHKGHTTWHGPHAGSEFFIPRKETTSSPISTPSELPVDLLLLSRQFPFKTINDTEDAVRRQIRARLPAKQVAYDASFVYYSRLTWSTDPILWDDFIKYIFNPIYEDGLDPADEQIATLFLVMAINILMDHTLPPWHPEAIQYYHLSRVSIILGEDLFQSRSLLVIQYLQMIAFYNIIVNDPNGSDKAWVAISMAVRLAQMAGLHRDNKQWDAYPEEAERRRRLWWDLISFETASAFTLGRPRAITATHFDTKLPHDDEDEGKPPTFNRTKYKWIANGIGSILDDAFGTQAPSYAVTLKIDKSIRDWPLDSIPSVEDVSKGRPLDLNMRFMIILMRSFSTTGLREIALLYLHRRYFVEALVRRPSEPLRSKYAMSVLAVHRSAVLLLQGVQRLDGIIGKIFPRIFFMWLHGLSAYICLCAIVINSPGCSLSRSCLVEIDNTKDLFARVTAYRFAHAKPVIAKLYEQAHRAMDMYNEGKWPPKGTKEQQRVCSDPDIDVMRFAGRSEFISTPERATPTSSVPETPVGGSPPSQVHPLLSEYLKQFQPGSSHTVESAVFSTEQSMLPPIMPGSTAFSGIDDFYQPELPMPPGINGLPAFDSSKPSYTTAPDWVTMLSSQEMQADSMFGNGTTLGTEFDVMPSTSDPPYSFDLTGLPEATSAVPDYLWDQFLSGLIPQDTQDSNAL